MKKSDRIEMIERLDAATLKGIGDRMDDASAAFLSRQLTYVRAQTIDVPHAPLNAFTVFPVQTEIPVGADTALQYYYDMVGMAELISNPADDLPRADVLAHETSVHVRQFGDAYGYSVQDLEQAAFARVSLSARKGIAAKRGIDIKLNKLAWNGDAKGGIVGFIDNENMSEYTLAADGTGAATTFESKTAVQMYRDVSNIIESIAINTGEVEKANTVIFAPKPYRALATTLYTTTNGQTTDTVLQMLQSHYPEITRWLKVSELHNADSTGTKDIVIAGYFDPDYIRFEIPKRFDQRPIQERNLEYIVNCLASSVGVTVSRPYCFTKAVGA